MGQGYGLGHTPLTMHISARYYFLKSKFEALTFIHSDSVGILLLDVIRCNARKITW